MFKQNFFFNCKYFGFLEIKNLFCQSMKVTDYIKNSNKTIFSFEIIPPLKGKGIEDICEGIDPLMEFKPPFINVTYHREEYDYKKMGNGLLKKVSIRKRPGTVGICAALMNRYKVVHGERPQWKITSVKLNKII